MKIAIFTDVYGPGAGGIATSIESQKRTLEEQGHDVTVFYPSLKKAIDKTTIVVPVCKHFHPDGIAVARRPRIVEKWILKNYSNFKEFDIVHSHYEAGCSIAGMRLARYFGIPLVQTMHGREDSGVMENFWSPFKTIVAFLLCWWHSWYLPHYTKVHKDDHLATSYPRAFMWSLMVNHANYADLVITPSKHFKNKLQYYGVKKPFKILTNTIDDALLPKDITMRKLENGEPLRVIWNSRLSHEKRIWEFLHAIARVDFPYKLEVYGSGNELAKAKLWSEHRKLPIAFHGSQPRERILSTMKKSHLGILASYNFDNQPMTLLEAVAAGLPMFFCDPDMKEVVPKGSYICASGPYIPEMTESLNQLYQHPEQIAKMSKIAMAHRKDVLRSTHKKELIEIYRKLQKH